MWKEGEREGGVEGRRERGVKGRESISRPLGPGGMWQVIIILCKTVNIFVKKKF